jgi:hypothetical protein
MIARVVRGIALSVALVALIGVPASGAPGSSSADAKPEAASNGNCHGIQNAYSRVTSNHGASQGQGKAAEALARVAQERGCELAAGAAGERAKKPHPEGKLRGHEKPHPEGKLRGHEKPHPEGKLRGHEKPHPEGKLRGHEKPHPEGKLRGHEKPHPEGKLRGWESACERIAAHLEAREGKGRSAEAMARQAERRGCNSE